MLFRPRMGDDVEDDLAGPSSSALVSYGPSAVTTPSYTTAPYFGPDISASGDYISPGGSVLAADTAAGVAARQAASSSSGGFWSGLANAFSTGVGQGLSNLFKPPSAKPSILPAPQSSTNMLLVVGGIGAAVVIGALLLRRRSA